MSIVTCEQVGTEILKWLLAPFGIEVAHIRADHPIPGSFWGDPEAGIVGNSIFVRDDTPAHSALHEACHWICMDHGRRTNAHTDAGGDVAEENAVCFLQVLLADEIPGFRRRRLFADMDTWGYSFRLGSARAWFDQDAEDARTWLLDHGLINDSGRLTWQVRR